MQPLQMKGKSVGALTRLQKRFAKRGLVKPLYIECQHHVLDAILKHVTGDFFDGATISSRTNKRWLDMSIEDCIDMNNTCI